jgi:hypothetical protein
VTLSGFVNQCVYSDQKIEIIHCETKEVLYKRAYLKFGNKKGSKELADKSDDYSVWEVQAKAGSVLVIGVMPN